MWRSCLRLSSAIGLTLLAGCAEHGVLSSPTALSEPQLTVAPDGYDTPTFGSVEEVPPEFLFAEVRNEAATMQWTDKTAKAWAKHEYFANRGTLAFDLTLLYDVQTVAHVTPAPKDAGSWYPTWRTMEDDLVFAVDKSCGHTANLRVLFTAKSVVFVASAFTTFGTASKTLNRPAAQPNCNCDGGGSGAIEPPSRQSYDPYSPTGDPYISTSTSDDCSGGDGGGSDGPGTGSGTCYEVLVHYYRSDDGGVTWYYDHTESLGIICG